MASSVIRDLGIPCSLCIDDRLNGELVSRDGCWSVPVPPFERDRDFSYRAAQVGIYIVCYLLVDLGYFLCLAKSVLQPSTRITYLGLVVETARQAFLLPRDKVVKFAKLREACNHLCWVKSTSLYVSGVTGGIDTLAILDTWEDCIPWRDEKHFILSISSDSSGFAWGGVFHLPEGNLEVGDYWIELRRSCPSYLYERNVGPKQGSSIVSGCIKEL